MSQRIATVVLLVEDVRQEDLLRRYLQRLGVGNRNIRVNKTLSGSGEHHVREQYASEVRALRQRLARTRSLLVTCLDADQYEVRERQAHLKRALEDADQKPRQRDEPIVDLLPKRNVETWILCLNHHVVDELSDYRHDGRVGPEALKNAAQVLFDWTRPNAGIPDLCVPSLRDCLPEFRRIPA